MSGVRKIQLFSNTNFKTLTQNYGIISSYRITPISMKPRLLKSLPYSPIRQFHKTKVFQNLPQFGPQPKPSKFKITKDKLLAQASGPLSRLLIHIKWPLKRNNKPFSIDDASTFFSWLVMGNVLWIVLGTTTFGFITLYSLHTFENLKNKINAYFNNDNNDNDDDNNNGNGNSKDKSKIKDNGIAAYLTSSILSFGLGVNIQFYKGNVLPEFKDGKLIFKNLEINSVPNEDNGMKFNCHLQSLNLSLSFGKWYDGNGLINDLEIFGLNGKFIRSSNLPTVDVNEKSPVVFRMYHDNTHFQYDMDNQTNLEFEEPKKIGSRIDSNYQLNSVRIHDSYIEIFDSDNLQTENIKPLKISIFNCEIPKLTGETLLIDFFNAKNAVGAINDSMFTIHKKPGYNSNDNNDDDQTIRFKLDGVDMGNLASINPKLRFNWILNGKAEIVADIRLPSNKELKEDSLFNFDYKNTRISEMISSIINDIANANNNSYNDNNNQNQKINDETKNDDNDDTKLMKGALHAIYQTFNNNDDEHHQNTKQSDTLSEYVIVNATVKFYNLKASLPKELPVAYSGNVPFITLHDLRSLIAYINKLENQGPIVVKTTVIEKLTNLYNSENLTQTKVFDVLVSDIYEEFLKLVKLDEKRIIEEKSTLWSHSLASQLLLLGLGAIV